MKRKPDLENYPADKKIEQYEFSFKAHIGSGSYGKVYLGRNINSQKLVAIKVMSSNLMED